MAITDRHHRRRDKNKATLPQTPGYEKGDHSEEEELSKELAEQYKLKSKPGFTPTEVERKK